MPRGRPKKNPTPPAKVEDKTTALIGLLKENPNLVDKMVDFLQSGAQSSATPPPSPGSVTQEKGPVIGEVFEGLTVCAICGGEQKTWTVNTQGTVTQCICPKCNLQLSLMPPGERQAFLNIHLEKNHLDIAKAKFSAMRKIWVKQREKTAQEKETLNFNPMGDQPE